MLKHLISLVFLLILLSYKSIYADSRTKILPLPKPKIILGFVKEKEGNILPKKKPYFNRTKVPKDNRILPQNKPLVSGTTLADIDVLRFWPAGRPGASGGLQPYTFDPDSMSLAGGTIVHDTRAPSELNYHTWIYINQYLGEQIRLPLTTPSYIHGSGTNAWELYPIQPEVGPWIGTMRDIGITGWNWTSFTAPKRYGRFTDKWHQNLKYLLLYFLLFLVCLHYLEYILVFLLCVIVSICNKWHVHDHHFL
mgnify:CR=1 FL=1